MAYTITAAQVESWMVRKVNTRAAQALMLNSWAAANPKDKALAAEAERMTNLAVFGPGNNSVMSILGLDRIGHFLSREYDLENSFDKKAIVGDYLDNLSPALRRLANAA